MNKLQAAIENVILGWIGNGGEMEELQPVVDAARKYANLPDFPGFDHWHDALVVRKVEYIDEHTDFDDGLIEWVAAVLKLMKTEAPDGQ